MNQSNQQQQQQQSFESKRRILREMENVNNTAWAIRRIKHHCCEFRRLHTHTHTLVFYFFLRFWCGTLGYDVNIYYPSTNFLSRVSSLHFICIFFSSLISRRVSGSYMANLQSLCARIEGHPLCVLFLFFLCECGGERWGAVKSKYD